MRHREEFELATIVVADDEEDVRELIRKLLTRLGHSVLAVADGKQALELLDRLGEGVDLVITDMLMPQRDGIEVVMECKRRGYRVIGISGEDRIASAGILEPARLLGASAVIRKPFSTAEFARVVTAVLAGEPPG